MAIDPNRPVCGPGQTPQQPGVERKPDCKPPQDHVPHRRRWNKDHVKLGWDGKGDPRYVDLPPGEDKGLITKAGNATWEQIAHAANKVKMAIAMPELAPDREVVGYVVNIDRYNSADGDITMDIVPSHKDRDVLEYRGQHRALSPDMDVKGKIIPPQGIPASRGGTLHTEAHEDQFKDDPELEKQLDRITQMLEQGKTPMIKMHGQWTFDPFHDGWMEIHPIKGIEILDPDAVPPPATPPRSTSTLWADPKAKFSASRLTDGYTLRAGGTMGNGGGVMFQGGKDLLYFGTKPGYIGDKDGNIVDYKAGMRGTLAGEGAGILAAGGNQGRLGGALGIEYLTWGNAIRAEAVGGQAFSADPSRQGPYVGGRLSYTLNEGPGNSRLGLFVQVDKTIARDGPVTGTVGLSFGY